jgi:hypothetical protein
LQQKLRQFLAYYNVTMAHPFNWTYTGKPLRQPLRNDYWPPHRRRLPSRVKLAKALLSCPSEAKVPD